MIHTYAINDEGTIFETARGEAGLHPTVEDLGVEAAARFATGERISTYEDDDVTSPLPAWVRVTDPTPDETFKIAERYQISLSDIRTATDDEEGSRVHLAETYLLILIDVPYVEMRQDRKGYQTLPLALFITNECVVSVSLTETPSFDSFIAHAPHDLDVRGPLRFAFQLILETCSVYQSYLRDINKRRISIEEHAVKQTHDADLIELHELESSLVYLATSLEANEGVFERIAHSTQIVTESAEQGLFEDVLIESRQAIEMASIYREIIESASNMLSAMINNRLNNIMKYLTAITIVLSIPAITSGLYGMNVDGQWMPLSTTPYGFWWICLMTVLICIGAYTWLKHKKML